MTGTHLSHLVDKDKKQYRRSLKSNVIGCTRKSVPFNFVTDFDELVTKLNLKLRQQLHTCLFALGALELKWIPSPRSPWLGNEGKSKRSVWCPQHEVTVTTATPPGRDATLKAGGLNFPLPVPCTPGSRPLP